MPLRIIDHGKEFHIKWDFDHWHKRNLAAVKSIGIYRPNFEYNSGATWVEEKQSWFFPVAKYNAKEKVWVVPGFMRDVVMQLVKTHHAEVIDKNKCKPEEIGELPPIAELTVDLPLKATLRPYQRQGIAQAMKFQQCLIGDEMGLGKTLQSIGAIVGLNAFPCLVVCPASTKLNWQREWHKFSDKRAMVLDSLMGAQKKRNWFSYVSAGMVDVVIVNYESISAFMVESYPAPEKTKAGEEKKRQKPWTAKDVVLKPFMQYFKSGILDESHRTKDPTTLQSRFILKIFSVLQYKLLLSGTPVVNKPIDLFPQLAILGKLPLFGGKAGFLERYCEGGTGANNLKELNYKLQLHCFFRREKKDVAKDLPDKFRQTILCDITTRQEYDRCQKDFEQFLIDNGCDDETVARKMRGEIMVKMGQLKSIAGRGKMNEVKEFVNEVLESGEKLILFCHLHSIVDECLNIWPKAVTITGRDSMEQRQRNIDAFQSDPKVQLIICNHKAAGVGITLTASSRVAFIEYPWTYADCVQCEDRSHRIGVKNTVMCTYFLGQDTIDERMWEIISEKMAIGNAITGASDMMQMEMIDKTLNLFKLKKEVA
jgi:SWI/SNF-related matrix-associated actin-dependent regulator of chromatin subfamily A-like protein 1